MRPAVVVDAGNSRLKWGRCLPGQLAVSALPLDDLAAWQTQFDLYALPSGSLWAVSGSRPASCTKLSAWLNERGQQVLHIQSYTQIPLQLAVDVPAKVGLDRLLNAWAVQARQPGRAALIVDAGSAVTVDLVTASGVFAGGAIFPGFRLMSQALHDYTELLPLVEIREPAPAPPGRATEPALRVGIYGAVVGGIAWLCRQMRTEADHEPTLYLTGGDSATLLPALQTGWPNLVHEPELTLQGVRLAAERLSA